jgi:hypothetical protein
VPGGAVLPISPHRLVAVADVVVLDPDPQAGAREADAVSGRAKAPRVPSRESFTGGSSRRPRRTRWVMHEGRRRPAELGTFPAAAIWARAAHPGAPTGTTAAPLAQKFM